MPGDPFTIDLPTDTPLRRAAAPAARPLLRWALRLNTIGELYRTAETMRTRTDAPADPDPGDFARRALRVLDIRTEFESEDVCRIPAEGPLIISANHPHGALDGLVLLDLVAPVRSDVRLIANHLLARIPDLRDLCFFVDPFERHDSMQRTLPGLRAAHLWLRRGGAVIVFPAGEVAHARQADGSVLDSPWRTTVGRLATATGARVLPVHISGENSRMFYAAGQVHPLLRSVLLARELLRKRGSSVYVRSGRILSATELAGSGHTASSATERIREAVEEIRLQPEAPARVVSAFPGRRSSNSEGGRRTNAIAEELAEDVERLPAEATLLSSGTCDVYCAEARWVPRVLLEIGRLREQSFRAVGEGTGKPADLDAFDDSYLHLFVWNRERREVVGAYRIGRSDQIVASSGVAGLYTRSLFRYDETLLRNLSPALELGRSFVRPEYQRDSSALMLLWKGICAFVRRHPHYRVLFGAVSISARYSDRTRDMLIRFLEQNHLDHTLAEQVSPLQPWPAARATAATQSNAPRTIDDADALTSQFEGDGRAMPVLLRQYLKLNARVLGFSVDPLFNDALDALMMIDLLRVDVRILRRYFGRDGADAFLAHHLSASHAA